MRVWLIKTGEQIPGDPGSARLLRTGILAEHMAGRGHDVTWWNATVNHQRKIQRHERTEVVDAGARQRIVLLYGRLYASNVSLARILSHRENASEFTRMAAGEPRPDVILCSYPTIELAVAATRYARANGVPIVIDYRDMWPDIVEDHLPKPLRVLARPVMAHWRAGLRYTVEHATGITGITEPFVDWALAQSGRRRGPHDRAFHLAINPTSPAPDDVAAAEKAWDELGVVPDPAAIIGCYTGTFSDRLDLPALIEGVKALPAGLRDRVKLVLCGRGALDEPLRRMAGGHPNILIPGWRSVPEIHVLLRRSNFGVLPYPSSGDFLLSFPNKVGEYLSAGLPVLTGLKGITRTMLDERGIGHFYAEGEPASVAGRLEAMLAGKAALQRQQEAALATFKDLFDGARIYPEYCNYLERIAGVRVAEPTR